MNSEHLTLSEAQIRDFLEVLWGYYKENGRHDLPWRMADSGGSFDPYRIMVSELMLQQTQVSRVVPKYAMFLERYPNMRSLADAELGDVLRMWQGLGYNRRAKYLWQAAREVTVRGTFPTRLGELITLPGVGVNTAGAIMAYAYNDPTVFVETNIRTVYIHHFFADVEGVDDKQVRQLLAQIIDQEHPREFYWALMDYGSWLKTQVRNTSQSKHYTRQTTFEGSRRQIRGQVIRELSSKSLSISQLQNRIPDARLAGVLEDLEQEGLIQKHQTAYTLA